MTVRPRLPGLLLSASLALLAGCGPDAARVERLLQTGELAPSVAAGHIADLVALIERPVADPDLDARAIDLVVRVEEHWRTAAGAGRDAEVEAQRGRLRRCLLAALAGPPAVDAAALARRNADPQRVARQARAWRLHALARLYGDEHLDRLVALVRCTPAVDQPEAVAVVLARLGERVEALRARTDLRRAALLAAASVPAAPSEWPSASALAPAAGALGAALLRAADGVPLPTALGDLAALIGDAMPTPAERARLIDWSVPIALAAGGDPAQADGLAALLAALTPWVAAEADGAPAWLAQRAEAALLRLSPATLVAALLSPPPDAGGPTPGERGRLSRIVALLPLAAAQVAAPSHPDRLLVEVAGLPRLDLRRLAGADAGAAILRRCETELDPAIARVVADAAAEAWIGALLYHLPAPLSRVLAGRLADPALPAAEALRLLRWLRAYDDPRLAGRAAAGRAQVEAAAAARLPALLAGEAAEAVVDELLAAELPGRAAALRTAALAAAWPEARGAALARLWLAAMAADGAPPDEDEVARILAVPGAWPLMVAADRLPAGVRFAAWRRVFTGAGAARDPALVAALLAMQRRDGLERAAVVALLAAWIPADDDGFSLAAALAALDLTADDAPARAALVPVLAARWPALREGA